MSNTQQPGVAFALQSDGTRSTTPAGARIVSAALKPVNRMQALAALQEDHWRRTYPQYFRGMVEGGLADSEAALSSARAGLDTAWNTLCWHTGSEDITLAEAMQRPARSFQTLTVQGTGDAAVQPWGIPLQGDFLTGSALRAKIEDWRARGIIEPSAAKALQRCMDHPEWFDLSDRTLVLLGAGSEAGPLRWLLRWRARVVALDIDRAAVWQRLHEMALQGNGSLLVPLRTPSADPGNWHAHAGANLISEGPEIAAWLLGLQGPLDVLSLAYLDGERHVRVSMGMDMVARAVSDADHRNSLAYLATPTDVFAVPEDAAQTAMAAYAARDMGTRTFQSSLHLAWGDRFFQPNVDRLIVNANGHRYGVVDSMVIEQGPNYALAKRLQQWRALLARVQGTRVSLNIAPSTTTASVVKNPALAAGFAGASAFGLEIFEPETTNALMAALWVHDLRSDDSAANPARVLDHPYALFMDNACHGGLWRSAYMPRTALPFAAALGWVRGKLG